MKKGVRVHQIDTALYWHIPIINNKINKSALLLLRGHNGLLSLVELEFDCSNVQYRPLHCTYIFTTLNANTVQSMASTRNKIVGHITQKAMP